MKVGTCTERRPRRKALLGLLTMAAVGVAMLLPTSAFAAAAFTATNPVVDNGGTGDPVLCLNGGAGANTGSGAINCNLYTSKNYVWLNAGPGPSGLGDGTYFFAVLSPGGQPAPNDGGTNNANGLLANLSDDFDGYTNRTFSLSGGVLSYGGTHDFDGEKIRLMPYEDTPNNGGVYILAICSLADGYPVSPRDCKYDAFKIREGDEQNPPASDLAVIKTVSESVDRTYQWTIDKDVDATFVQTKALTHTFNYTVTVEHDTGTDSGWLVTGEITVFNPNDFAVSGVDVTDSIDDASANCIVTDGSNATIPANSSESFDYECTYSAEPAAGTENTATATWSATGNMEGTSGSASFLLAVDFSLASIDELDECIDVTDDFDGSGPVALGTACVGDPNPATFNYSKVVNVPRNDCATYDNTAAFETNDTGATDDDSQSVTVCGPITGGFTIGFWTNKNGEKAFNSCTGNNTGAATVAYLVSLNLVKANGTAFDPTTYKQFRDWLNAAEATNMSYMLSAQLAGTALNVRCMGMDGDAYVAHPFTGNPIAISALIAEANAFLADNAVTTQGTARADAEKYKNLLDDLNNNKVFAVPGP